MEITFPRHSSVLIGRKQHSHSPLCNSLIIVTKWLHELKPFACLSVPCFLTHRWMISRGMSRITCANSVIFAIEKGGLSQLSLAVLCFNYKPTHFSLSWKMFRTLLVKNNFGWEECYKSLACNRNGRDRHDGFEMVYKSDTTFNFTTCPNEQVVRYRDGEIYWYKRWPWINCDDK